jgi:hypothetical protein
MENVASRLKSIAATASLAAMLLTALNCGSSSSGSRAANEKASNDAGTTAPVDTVSCSDLVLGVSASYCQELVACSFGNYTSVEACSAAERHTIYGEFGGGGTPKDPKTPRPAGACLKCVDESLSVSCSDTFALARWSSSCESLCAGICAGQPVEGWRVMRTQLKENLWDSVWAFSPSDVWVGSTTVAHFDGVTWTKSLEPYGSYASLWGSGPTDVWAGNDSAPQNGGEPHPLYRWDGATWTLQAVPLKSVSGISGSGPTDVWALSYSEQYHWDGVAWSSLPSKTAGSAIGVTSPSDAWLVSDRGAIVHFDGSGWIPVASPTTTWIGALWAHTPSDVWAVGGSGLILHYDGDAWGRVANRWSSNLRAVSGFGNEVWAVGDDAMVLHFDGSTWQRSVVPVSNTLDLKSISIDSDGRVWIAAWEDTILVHDPIGTNPTGSVDAGTPPSAADASTPTPAADAGGEEQSAVSFELTVGAVTGFESSEDSAVAFGTTQMSNPNTTVVVGLDTTEPISGAQTLRIRFDYRNETAAWQQWSFVRMALRGAPQDLSGLGGVRFKVRSDQSRGLRLDLFGSMDAAARQGINFGWDVTSTAATQTVEVRFADAKLPSWASTAAGTTLAATLVQVEALLFRPMSVGEDSTGQLPAGTSDSGWVEIDDVEFF